MAMRQWRWERQARLQRAGEGAGGRRRRWQVPAGSKYTLKKVVWSVENPAWRAGGDLVF